MPPDPLFEGPLINPVAEAMAPKSGLATRRDFLQRLAASVCTTAYLAEHATEATAQLALKGTAASLPGSMKTESDIGSLFPFVQSQAVKSNFPLSFLSPKLKSY